MSKSTIPAVKAFTEKWDSKVMNAEEAFKEFCRTKDYMLCRDRQTAYQMFMAGYNAAKPDENLKECLNYWTADGRLQTFEDRERFRKEATILLTTQQ